MNNISIDQLLKFLQKVDDEFDPTLSAQVDLKAYSERLIYEACLVTVCDDEGDIIGLVVIYLNEKTNPNAYIPLVAVAPNKRRQGVAKRLVKRALILAKESQKEIVGIHTNNMVAYSMYKSLGFVDVDGEENRAGHQKLKYIL